MAVYVAAGDESDGPRQSGPFVYGGLVGPNRDWSDWFAPAWEERVLNGKPPIEYFHMSAIRNPRWQRQHGLKPWEATRRIEEAVNVIASSGSIHLVRTSFDGGHFRQLFGSARVMSVSQRGTYPFDPDYVGFMGFIRGVLEYVHTHHDDAEKVDFLVERKQRVSHYLPNYLDHVETWLTDNGRSDLVGLVGELIPVDKKRVPVQAADLAMWHVRRHEARESDADDVRRLIHMFHGRTMTLTGMTNDEITRAGFRLLGQSDGKVRFDAS